MSIKYDIETYPLQIMTDSVVGSGDVIRVGFYTEDDDGVGAIKVKFNAIPVWAIGFCTDGTGWVTFTLPEEQVITWTITKTGTSVAIWCNCVEIVDYQLSDSINNECVPHWSKDAVKMSFRSTVYGIDTASDEYRSRPTGKQKCDVHIIAKIAHFNFMHDGTNNCAQKRCKIIIISTVLLKNCL